MKIKHKGLKHKGLIRKAAPNRPKVSHALGNSSEGTACVCGHSVEEHGNDDAYPGSTACSECPDGDCVAYESEG